MEKTIVKKCTGYYDREDIISPGVRILTSQEDMFQLYLDDKEGASQAKARQSPVMQRKQPVLRPRGGNS